jgi:hypothetical protein
MLMHVLMIVIIAVVMAVFMGVMVSIGVMVIVIMIMIMIMVMVMMVMMTVVVVMVVIVLMIFWLTAACDAHTLCYLQFFYSKFLSRQDLHLVAGAGRAWFVVGLHREFLAAFKAAPPTGYPVDDEPRPLEESSLGARLEAELDGFRHDIAQFADLEDHREDLPSGCVGLADLYDTLGNRHFVHRNTSAGGEPIGLPISIVEPRNLLFTHFAALSKEIATRKKAYTQSH